ncbi:MAG TPA: hypothetical protein VMX76_00950 [Nevskiaceae bacterium]|nr:hypothetical protein [Nevskiaceae bacterium]
MAKQKTIDVRCKNGHLLFEEYKKVGSGRLIKCYIDKIKIDHVGVSNLPDRADIFCPQCKKKDIILRVGRIGMIHGRPAVLINHGGTKPIRT